MQLTFRPLEKSDFELFAKWLGKPHVSRWWREPATAEHVAKEYGACTDGDFTTRVYIVLANGIPIGVMQVFRVESYPETAELLQMPGAVSIDYFIGEDEYIGKGVGTEMIKQFLMQIVRPLYPDATGVATSAEVDNFASLAVLAKSGFAPGRVVTGEYHTPERVMRLSFQ